jgi:hypothetical protein
VDIEVQTRNKDEKTGEAKKDTDEKKDGKNDASGEQQTSPMDVDDKHEKEGNTSAARSERGSPVAEGWMVVNKDTLQQGMNLCFEFICIMP